MGKKCSNCIYWIPKNCIVDEGVLKLVKREEWEFSMPAPDFGIGRCINPKWNNSSYYFPEVDGVLAHGSDDWGGCVYETGQAFSCINWRDQEFNSRE